MGGIRGDTCELARAAHLEQGHVVAHDVGKQTVQGRATRPTAAAQNGAVWQHQAAQQRKVVVTWMVADIEWAPADLRVQAYASAVGARTCQHG